MTQIAKNESNQMVALAKERLEHYHRHGSRMWKWHGWLIGWTLLVNVLVPFGLASLLYLPETYRNNITLFLLALSGLALALQLLTVVQRFKERALQLRVLHSELQSALVEYQAGSKTAAEFSAILERVMKKHTEESAP